jgi:hypothetical protein
VHHAAVLADLAALGERSLIGVSFIFFITVAVSSVPAACTAFR